MFERLKTMLIKEFIQILRNPKMRFIVFGVPIVQIILFGYAVNTDVKNISTGIYDMDNSSTSREFIEQLVQSGYFTIVKRIGLEAEIRDLMDKGRIKVVVRINRGFEELVKGGRRSAPLQIIIDGTRTRRV
jgi:ABC-2 type transport system permease protein